MVKNNWPILGAVTCGLIMIVATGSAWLLTTFAEEVCGCALVSDTAMMLYGTGGLVVLIMLYAATLVHNISSQFADSGMHITTGMTMAGLGMMFWAIVLIAQESSSGAMIFPIALLIDGEILPAVFFIVLVITRQKKRFRMSDQGEENE